MKYNPLKLRYYIKLQFKLSIERMSIYSGFSTRNQETEYSKNLYSLIFLVQHTLAKIIRSNINLSNEYDSKKFRLYFKKIYEKVSSDEQYKYLPPKFSMAFVDLANIFSLDTEASKDLKYLNDTQSISSVRRKVLIITLA